MFISADHGREQSDGTSKTNFAEVGIVVQLVQQLLKADIPMAEIGVVTAYGSQVRVVLYRLP